MDAAEVMQAFIATVAEFQGLILVLVGVGIACRVGSWALSILKAGADARGL